MLLTGVAPFETYWLLPLSDRFIYLKRSQTKGVVLFKIMCDFHVSTKVMNKYDIDSHLLDQQRQQQQQCRYLLSGLSARGYLIVATPFALNFDYLTICDEVNVLFMQS